MLNKKYVFALLAVMLLLFSCSGKKGEAEPANSAESGEPVENTVVKPKNFIIAGNVLSVPDKDGNVRSVAPAAPATTQEEVAYALAMQVIDNTKGIFAQVYGRDHDENLTVSELAAFLQGIIDAENGQEMEYDYFMQIGEKLQSDAEALAAKKAEAAKNYFESLESKPGIVKTDSGLMYEIVTEGAGEGGITEKSKVNVDYVMSVYQEGAENNMVEADKNEDIDFVVSNLIPGVIEGMKLMKEGSEYIFYINPDLGYGPIAVSPVIGANSYLIFKVKVNRIIPDEPAAENNDGETSASESDSTKDSE